ncbi:MAG: MBL fold metallo-hydrolase [candidate division KSB1 bacterium]|nr:MBL fold metallo-hydrolase [candidate division KSB1 bacterium]
MNRLLCFWAIVCLTFITSQAGEPFEKDTVRTADRDLVMTFIGHGTLMFEYGDTVIHIDPVGRYADYGKLPKADLVLITHHHFDHLDADAIKRVSKKNTRIILTEKAREHLEIGVVMNNGETMTVQGIPVKALPAYNIKHVRDNGEPFHPKGDGNGYVLTFADKIIYIAGDTENIPEMQQLEKIDIAFLPMNLPYTMDPEMVFQTVQVINPGILYPYHFGNTDTDSLVKMLENSDTEIRIRNLE